MSLTLPFPVTVTWQYTDTDVVGLDEEELGLYRLMESELWQRVSCLAEQHYPEANQLHTCIQQLGTYVFGLTHERYLPPFARNGEESNPETQSDVQKVQQPERDTLPGLPLRLPPSDPTP